MATNKPKAADTATPETPAAVATPQGLGEAPAPRKAGEPTRTKIGGGITKEDF